VLIHLKIKDIQPVWWKKESAAAEVIFSGGQQPNSVPILKALC
jgi:hypothetical protein